MIFLTSLYKMAISTQQIPSSWRNMDVMFIPKPGKEDYSSPKSLILCPKGIGEDHAVVSERKSGYKSTVIPACLHKGTLDRVSLVGGSRLS